MPRAAGPPVAELIRYATLAPSGHNTQPWRFRIARDAIVIAPDLGRRTPVVDPDDHHLYASLGCAAENLSIAARASGYAGRVDWVPAGAGAVRVDLAPAPSHRNALFDAIPNRRLSRALYDGREVARETLERLERAARVHGVTTRLVRRGDDLEPFLRLIVAANDAQVRDPAFVAELLSWIRFNARSAAAHGDGLFAPSTGAPALPDWLGPLAFRIGFRPRGQNAQVAKAIRSSAGLLVFVAASDEPCGWVDVGRAYQRFALQATLCGLQHAFVNQATEVPSVRRELQALLDIGERRPSLMVRFGHGPSMPRSYRRPLGQVIDEGV